MNDVSSNRDRLREVGLIGDELYPEHEELIAELSEEEVNALVSIKERLDARGIPAFTLAKMMPIL